MTRLTRVPFKRRPDDSLENYKVKNDNRDYETSLQNCINKLGKLEDLEEQLGCPLKVVFKALKEGIYKVDEDILFEATLRIKNNEIYLCQPYDDMLLHKVYTKDYQKTWWLKGEKPNE